jgi:hypothetical protein
MGKGLPRSMRTGAQAAKQTIMKTVVRVRNVPVTVDGLTGIGFGTVVIGDLPQGNILFLGATAYMQFQGPTSANLVDTWTGNFSIGTAPTADATLSGAEIDIIPSTALAAATAELSPRTRGVLATAAIFDNTDDSLELNLNVLVADASIDANGVILTANGELALLYAVMLDD